MILYLDTSALVKLFVEEAHSDRIRRVASECSLITTHAIAFVEACAAFARLAHLRGEPALASALRGNLEAQWESWEIVQVADPLIRRAADFAGRYRLRGYDSVHLAAAAAVFEEFRPEPSFRFAVFDDPLGEAARRAGIPLLEA